MKTIWLSLTVAALALVSAGAQPAPTNINPALLYYQAFLLAPDYISEADLDYLYSREGAGQKLPDRFDKLFAGYNNEFTLLRAAARSTVPCDWGIDREAGPGALFPHLAPAKAAAVAARLRVRWNLQQGRQTEALGDLLATLKLARNLTRDGTLISVLVQIADEAIDSSTVAENFGRFTPESLQRIVEALDAPPIRGTVAASVPTERAIFEDWALRDIAELRKANPGDDAKVMTALHRLFIPDLEPSENPPRAAQNPDADQANLWAQISQAAGGTSEGVVKLIHDAKALDQRLAAILALPRLEFEKQMKQLEAELKQSPNPCFSDPLPLWERARQKEFKAQVFLAMVRAAVEYKLHGQAAFEHVNDPYGQGPFAFRRFVFEGQDRGFELTSVCTLSGWPEVMIFVEKEGPGFWVNGRPGHVGQSMPKAGEPR